MSESNATPLGSGELVAAEAARPFESYTAAHHARVAMACTPGPRWKRPTGRSCPR